MDAERQEQPAEREVPIYRSWRRDILPDCVVIAVDERDPQRAGRRLSVPQERPPYPVPPEALADRAYVRAKRARLQAIYAVGAASTHETTAAFGQWLAGFVATLEKAVLNGDTTHEVALQFFQAILRDYEDDPDAPAASRQ